MTAVKGKLLLSKASAKYVRITPRKMRLVADLVRGKKVNEAVNMLGFTHKRSAGPIEKVVRSALANLLQQDAAAKLDPADAIIQEIRVDEGPMLKRWRPRAMGRAYHIQKKTSHLTVVVSAPEPVAVAKPKPGKTAKPKATATAPTKPAATEESTSK